MKKLIKVLSATVLAISSLTLMASEGGLVLPNDLMPSYSEDKLTVSMQKGMQVYMNNCLGCHSLAFQRYNRAAKDLLISEDLMVNNLMFTGEKVADLITNTMPKASAENWFGTAPPDLSLIARSRSPQWLYNYLRAFYSDNERPYNVNNSVFKDVGMPHALEALQGIQDKTDEVKGLEHAIEYAHGDVASANAKIKASGSSAELSKIIADAEELIHEKEKHLSALSLEKKYFTLIKEGELTPEEFDLAMTDLVNFLEYVAEPIKRDRKSMGVYVLLFILFFTAIAYLLKKEYWKDVH